MSIEPSDNKLQSLIENFLKFFGGMKSKISHFFQETHFAEVKTRLYKKPSIIALIAVIFLGAVFFVVRTYRNINPAVNQIKISAPVATQELNREFNFSLKDSTGKEVGKIKYVIVSADERNEIVVKGQKATAVQGKTFLIINLKIINDLNSGVQINTKDYVRLSLNGDKNVWLAPDIHNDPVEVQAISTKLTRVGFAISTSDKNIILRVGEINGAKTDIPVDPK